MLIKIRDQQNPEIYFSLYNPDALTYNQILTAKFNLFIARTPASAHPREILYLDPPYDDSEIPPYMGWARIHSSGNLTQYLGAQDTDAYPLVVLYNFKTKYKTAVEKGRTTANGDGWCNRPKGIGQDIIWELQR